MTHPIFAMHHGAICTVSRNGVVYMDPCCVVCGMHLPVIDGHQIRWCGCYPRQCNAFAAGRLGFGEGAW